MPTGDGLLARIHPPLGVLTLAQARAVAVGARRYGNGHLDLTARANLQIRGVGEATKAPLAHWLEAAGLGDSRIDGGPQRLTLTSPLAGHDPAETIDIPALAQAIEAVGRAVPGLPAKTLVAVGMPLADADLSVTALGDRSVAITLASEDGPVPGFTCPVDEAPSRIGTFLAGFAESGRRRVRALTAGERAALVSDATPRSGPRHPAASQGIVPLEEDREAPGHATPSDFETRRHRAGASLVPGPGERGILALDAPFGRCTVEALERLVAVAAEIGAPEIRLSPSRGLVLIPSRPNRMAAHLALLSADFITTADDPRRAVAACTGAPACASGTTPTLHDASRLSEAFRPFAARGLSAHVSGCAKGCAKPGPADLTLVGRDGAYAIVLAGSPGDPPLLHIPIEAALERLGRAATVGFAAAFGPAADDGGRNRRPA
jgi:precorrin-3B synthase